MRDLKDTVEVIGPGADCAAMGGTIQLDGKECLHLAFQVTGAINEAVVMRVATHIRAMAKSRRLWSG